MTRLLILAGALAVLLAAGSSRADAPPYNIYELEYSDAAHDWESPHYGEIVKCVGGIVTHKFRQRIVLQDPTLGSEWAAIEVRGYPVYPVGLEIGDQADFDSVYVDEYRGVTVLQYYNASSHVVNSSGHPLPDPVHLTVWDLRYPPQPEDTERYTGMLTVIPERVTIGERDLGSHEDNYELVSLGGAIAWASDYGNTDIDSTYYVASGECYQRLVGIPQRYVYEDEWDYYQFLPRGIADYTPCGTDVAETAFLVSPTCPNPFVAPGEIAFALAHPGEVRVEIHDLLGRSVIRLVDGVRSAGPHQIAWDGRDARGRVAPAGIYLVRTEAGGQVQAHRVCLITR